MSSHDSATDVELRADVLVHADAVSKRFCRSLRRSLWYGVGDIMSDLNPFQSRVHSAALREDEFWAVRNVSRGVMFSFTLPIERSNATAR